MKRLLLAFAVLVASRGVHAAGPGSAGVWEQAGSETLHKEDFEDGEAGALPKGYEFRNDKSEERSQVLFGEVTRQNQALKYLIPFDKMGGRRLTLSFFARSPDRCRCALWISQQGQKRSLG